MKNHETYQIIASSEDGLSTRKSTNNLSELSEIKKDLKSMGFNKVDAYEIPSWMINATDFSYDSIKTYGTKIKIP